MLNYKNQAVRPNRNIVVSLGASLLAVFFALHTVSGVEIADAQENATPTPTATATPSDPERVWTIDEILNEPRLDPPVKPIEYCQNSGRFKPCVCTRDVAREMRYRPAVKECKGNAAIVLSGKYAASYSAVVRDSENRDRWPELGFGGCTPYQSVVLGLNKCSAFKVQKKLRVGGKKNPVTVNCLGASGYSALFKRVVRVTVKLSDVPNSNLDPLVRWCLTRPNLPLN